MTEYVVLPIYDSKLRAFMDTSDYSGYESVLVRKVDGEIVEFIGDDKGPGGVELRRSTSWVQGAVMDAYRQGWKDAHADG